MDFALPEIGEGVYEAELIRWLIEAGAEVKRGQPLAEVMTDKATMEVPSPFAGTITALRAQPGQEIKVGQTLLTYESAAKVASGGRQSPVAAKKEQGADAPRSPAVRATVPTMNNGPVRAEAGGRLPVKAAPSVRQLARKLGIDLTAIHGSGPEGRVLIEDLTPRIQAPAIQAALVEVAPDYGKPGTRIKLQGLRRTIAQRMVLSKKTIPHYSYVDECDVTNLVRLREGLRDAYAGAGVKLTYLPFFIKAVVAALKEVPIVNSSLDEESGEIVLHDRYHIGVAAATPAGLMVPVVHDADQKDIGAIAREIERLSCAARAGKSRREDLVGGTFTITSVGNFGGLIATPVINHPEVAILAIGKIVKRPVYDADGHIRPADMVYLSLSFDHRVVDGAVGAVFGNAIVRQLQNPAALLLPAQL
ncbi:MAG TPA: dihydrolipoamide acetyltransferase family protein [Gemmataceae bacterium]|jgi:pyruvate dehydrogenase E2 component (dihydrolipoamide acetyltransferase)/2-oxoisovalerate dehydrogenase E2 component (dihydrolipoyl transacylase)